ncbi:MAG TPA: hypothetical protein PLF27_10860 [Sedimentibacter sp.]|nr:hypothetical protein [Sedimentibacter sp.]
MDEKILISENQSYITSVLRKSFFKKTPLLLRVIIVYVPLLILNTYLLLLNYRSILSDAGMVIGLIFAIIWMCWGPILIYKYETNVYPKFWHELINVCSESDKDEVIKLNKKIRKKGKLLKKIIFISWISLIYITLYFGFDKLQVLGIDNMMGLDFAIFLFDIAIAAYLTSLGLGQTLIMIYTFFVIEKNINIPLDINNKDGVGNYSLMFKYCFPTTLYLGSGVLFIPVLIEFTSTMGALVIVMVSLLIVLCSLFLLFSMVLPLFKGYIMADRSKSVQIYELTKEMNKAIDECLISPTAENEIIYNAIKQKIEQISKIPTYPFQLNIIMKIASTTLLPIFVYILKLFFTPEAAENIKNLLIAIF